MEEGDGWVPPSKNQRETAIAASKARDNESLYNFLSKAEDSGLFPPMNRPGPSDWLANHKENGQTASAYITKRTHSRQKKVYIQPLGEFAEKESPSLSVLQEFAKLYLGVDAEVVAPILLSPSEDSNRHLVPDFEASEVASPDRTVLKPKGAQTAEITSRMNSGVRQLLTHDVHALLKLIKPDDAFCIMAVTMEDLYPSDSWNFVFGQASPSNHSGVFSFARYSPYFMKRKRHSLSEEDYSLLLHRSCKVMVHEIIHLFGCSHCIYYQCCMNGSNHLQESDERPVYLCPVDLHKLAAFHKYGIGARTPFDVEGRYRKLLEFYSRTKGFEEDAKWVNEVLGTLFTTQKE